MLSIGSGRIFLATAPVDMRRGHDGLVAFVRGELGADPYQGDLFVFVGRTRDRLKILGWDRGGFVLVYKRLAKGRFRLPSMTAGADRVTIDKTELAMILGGFDPSSAKRQSAWSPKRVA
jgi:transposase